MTRKPAPKMAEGWAALDGDAFELDAMLPEQYHGRIAEWTGEQQLMGAILEDAARSYLRGDPGVEEWFFGAASDWLYDYTHICETLELSAGNIRRRLVARRTKERPT